MKIHNLSILVCYAYISIQAGDAEKAIPMSEKFSHQVSDLSNLIEKNKIPFGLATASGGIAGFLGSQAIHKINDENKESIDIIRNNKTIVTATFTGLGTFIGFGIFAMMYGKRNGKIEGLKEAAQNKINLFQKKIEEIEEDLSINKDTKEQKKLWLIELLNEEEANLEGLKNL